MPGPDLPTRIGAVEAAMSGLAKTLATLERQRARSEQRERKLRAEERRQQAEEKREWNRQRGQVANKIGTLVEDMVAPSVGRVVASVFHLPERDPLERLAPRVRQRVGGETREIDVVAAWPGHVCVVEVKTRLRPEEIVAFVRSLPDIRRFLPEYADRKLIGAVASLYLEPSIVRQAERAGLIVMGLGDDLMDSKNTPRFVPREF